MAEICGDNRFELIEKYKTKLIEATNIETAKDEMAVIDNILFRFWQMGWLDKLEADVVPKSEVESINPIQEAIEQKKKENKESALGVLNELLDEKDAEIKRLKAENKTLQGDLVIWKQNRFNLYQRLELYKIAQEKVAREIFEKIDGIIAYDNFPIAHQKLVSEFAELKKKFVPDTNDGRKTESEGNP